MFAREKQWFVWALSEDELNPSVEEERDAPDSVCNLEEERDYAPEQESAEWIENWANHHLARTQRERANKRKNGTVDNILCRKQKIKRRGEMKSLHMWCATGR